jgi:hypothetical protein
MLVQLLKDRQTEGGLDWLLRSLSAVAARLDPQDAGRAGIALSQAMKDPKSPRALSWLARGLSTSAARMDPKDASAVSTRAAAALVEDLKDNANPYNSPAPSDTGLWEVAMHLQARDAAQFATRLVQAMKDAKNRFALPPLALGLSAVASRMEAKSRRSWSGS